MPATPAWPPASLPRLFVEDGLAEGATLTLDGPPANYLGTVLRLGPGAQVKLFDDKTGEWLAEIAEAGRKRVALIVGTKLRDEGGSLSFELGGANVELSRATLARHPELRTHVGRPLVVGIRPEHLEDAALVAGSNGSCVDVDCALAEPMGAELIAHVTFPGAPALAVSEPSLRPEATLTARLSPQSSARSGGKLRLAVDVDRLHFFDEETGQAIV